MKLYKKVATVLQAMENCKKKNNAEWFYKHGQTLDSIEKEHFPSGSGFDGNCIINHMESKENKLVIYYEWHCMNDHGYYDGWLNFDLIVTPDLQHDFNLHIVKYRHNMNQKYRVNKYWDILEDYFYDTWNEVLEREI